MKAIGEISTQDVVLGQYQTENGKYDHHNYQIDIE